MEPTGVIEHLTASLHDETSAVDSRASQLRDQWVARMIRFGSVPILIAALLNIYEFHHASGLRWSWALSCAYFNGLLAAGTLSLTFTGWFDKNWRPMTVLILGALVASDLVLGTAGGEPKLLFISLILLMVGSGSLLPWSRRFQVCFILLCLTAWAIQSAWVPSLDRMGPYKLMSLLTAAALSWFTCYVRDRFVREHEESERIVRESERTLRQMFDANTDGITLTDMETHRIIDVNASFVRVAGFSRVEVIGKTSEDLNLWPDAAALAEYRDRVRENRSVQNLEVNFRIKDGTMVPALVSSVIVTVHGRPCIMTLARDVTDLRKSQQSLSDSEEKFRLIFEASRDAIMLTRSPDIGIIEVNEPFTRLTGFSREEALGHTTTELEMWADPQQRGAFIKTLAESGYVDSYEMSIRNRDGRLIPVLISSGTLKLAGAEYQLSMARDISKLRDAEKKIRDSEATLRKIFDATIDGMTISEIATGNYLDVNDAFLQTTGYTQEEVIGSNFWKLGLWPDQKEWTHFIDTLITTGEVRNQPATFRRKDGQTAPCLISAVQCEVWGKLCCISTTRDISDLYEAQERLRRSEETFRKIFDTSLDAMNISDESGRLLDVNPEFLRACGYSRDEILGRSHEALDLWANPQQLLEFSSRLAEKGEVRNLRVDCHRKDGSILPTLVSGVMTEIDGKLCCLGVSRDISDITTAEEKVRKSETMMRAIFDASLDNVALIDLTDETIVEVNSELTRTIGYSRDEMIGKRFDDLVPGGDEQRQREFFAQLIQGREVRNHEMSVTSREGRRTFPVLVSASILELEGRPCALSAARDITDLVKAREAALAASRAKSEFVSIMSHEIRTSMNAILGMADLMGESELDSEQRRYLDTILSNGNALLDLINSILDLAKVESGRLSLENIDFDLVELSEHAADTLAVRAHEKGVELAVRFSSDVMPIVTGDPYRLRQVLNNLIGNAIKFTRQGEVLVRVEPNRDSSIPGNFIFSVRDTGIGIAPEKIDSIFSIFTQADTSTTRKFGGSGLGLAIVERLVGLMGGRVWVESEFGTGSTFYFSVDLRIHAGMPAQLPIAPELRGVRTLMVIENATTRAVIAEVLRAQGAVVIETSSEAQALDAIASNARAATAAHKEPARFQLMLIDGEMNLSDGFDALCHLRAAAPEAATVLLTNSNGLPAKLRRTREHGVRHHLTKPIKRHEFFSVVAEALAKSAAPRALAEPRRVTPAAAAGSSAVAARPLKILLADDSPDNRLLIRAYTKKTSYVLTEAENGQIAVDRYKNASFDLVLMDIQMPVLDGYSAVRAIRKWEQEKSRPHTPIIALTASALEEDVRRAKEAGCDMHVSKPVKKSTLLESIASAIDGVGSPASSTPVDTKKVASGVVLIAHVAPEASLAPVANFDI